MSLNSTQKKLVSCFGFFFCTCCCSLICLYFIFFAFSTPTHFTHKQTPKHTHTCLDREKRSSWLKYFHEFCKFFSCARAFSTHKLLLLLFFTRDLSLSLPLFGSFRYLVVGVGVGEKNWVAHVPRFVLFTTSCARRLTTWAKAAAKLGQQREQSLQRAVTYYWSAIYLQC